MISGLLSQDVSEIDQGIQTYGIKAYLTQRSKGFFDTIISECEAKDASIDEIKKNLAAAGEALKNARAQGDLSENAEYVNNRDKVVTLTADLERAMKSKEEISNAMWGKFDDYESIGIVIPYSTVLLSEAGNNDKVVIQLMPGTYSDTAKGRISMQSRLGKSLIRKKEGDIIVLHHSITGEELRLKIEGIY